MRTFDEWKILLLGLDEEVQPTAAEIVEDWRRDRFTLKNQIQNQTRKQFRNMLADFIWQHFKGQYVDAMRATLALQEQWGVRVDWHEFSNTLDEMSNRDLIQVKSGSGNVVYYIPKGTK